MTDYKISALSEQNTLYKSILHDDHLLGNLRLKTLMLTSKTDSRINSTCLCCVYLQPLDLVNRLVISLAIKLSFAPLCSLVSSRE